MNAKSNDTLIRIREYLRIWIDELEAEIADKQTKIAAVLETETASTIAKAIDSQLIDLAENLLRLDALLTIVPEPVQNWDDSMPTWEAWVERFNNDAAFREEQIINAFIGNVAMEKCRADLCANQEFMDGTVSRCILNSESVLLDDATDE